MTAMATMSMRVERRRADGATDVVLDAVSLQFVAGTATAIMGASGSGKSTLLHAITGLLATASGQVTWSGHDVHATSGGRRRTTHVAPPALVPQRAEDALAADRVDGDVGLVLQLRGAPPAVIDSSVDSALARCGLTPQFARRDPLRLSGGEQRRAAIAAAVAHVPPALLLDEPTAGLDAPARGAIARLVIEEAAAGRTVVVATHDPELALATCSRLVVLAAGRVAWNGPVDELLADAERCAALGISSSPVVEAAAGVARGLGLAAPRTCDVDTLVEWMVAVTSIPTSARPLTSANGLDCAHDRRDVTEASTVSSQRSTARGLVRHDPRAKVLAAALLLVASLAASTLAAHLALVAVLALAVFASGSDRRAVVVLLRPVAFVVAAIIVAQVLLGTHHDVHVLPSVTSDAPVVVAIDRAVQVLSVALVAIALTTTTPALRLADAIGRFARPARLLGLPVDELATTAGLALGLVPATAAASRRIELALRARGIDPERLGLVARVQVRRVALGALAVAAFRRSNQLADALAIRGFHPSVRRTELLRETVDAADVIIVVVSALFAALAISGVM